MSMKNYCTLHFLIKIENSLVTNELVTPVGLTETCHKNIALLFDGNYFPNEYFGALFFFFNRLQ